MSLTILYLRQCWQAFAALLGVMVVGLTIAVAPRAHRHPTQTGDSRQETAGMVTYKWPSLDQRPRSNVPCLDGSPRALLTRADRASDEVSAHQSSRLRPSSSSSVPAVDVGEPAISSPTTPNSFYQVGCSQS